ncbi:MAG: ribonuclease J [Cyanobacteria bacterium]|nr:ribonuclease J [Cyanobacteriota bacterium]
MAHIKTGSADIQYDSLAVIPLGGQSEFGQLLWILTFGGEIVLVDAGAAYPAEDLPGVDLLFPNTNFLEANQDRIIALLLTNGHEEHCGGVSYLLRHLKIPKIMAPRFVAQTLVQSGDERVSNIIDTVEVRTPYQIGPFEVEWMRVNNAIADSCGLKIGTPEGTLIYTSSFKLDQTPVDKEFFDFAGFAGAGDKGVTLLISDSAGVENPGYTPSELTLRSKLGKHVLDAEGRVVVVFPGTNTHRLQILFDLATIAERKVLLLGDALHKTALAAAVTGNLVYDRKIECTPEQMLTIRDERVLVLAGGIDDDPLRVLDELAYRRCPELELREGDTVIYSGNVVPGKLRHMAMILDELLSLGVFVVHGKQAVHVSKHASREELKLMLSMTKPRYFVPSVGEGRHIMHHAQLAMDWGLDSSCVFPVNNGDILELKHGVASVIGTIEAQSVLFNREQGERVTTFSVHERRALSLEGVVTVALTVDSKGTILAGPSITSGASGFVHSPEWANVCNDLVESIVRTVEQFAQPDGKDGLEIAALRSSVREVTIKTFRQRLQAKPTVQVVVHLIRNERKTVS